jgi:hypothetical protein
MGDPQVTQGVNGGPWWSKLILQVGAGSAIAGWIIYWFTQTATPELRAQTQDVAAMKGMLTSHIEQAGRTYAEMLYYHRQTCINIALLAKRDPDGCVYKEIERERDQAERERSSGQPPGRIFDR